MGTSTAAFERELYLHERVMAAAGAGTIASVLVNPLDVVKTRMQAQATSAPRIPGEQVTSAALETRNWVLANGHYTWPTRSPNDPPMYVPRQPLAQYRSTLDGLVKITRTEGYKVLYRGMDLNLLVGVPMICMYLPAYDKLSSYFHSQGVGSLSPLLAGSCARTVAVLATSPVELLKTRLQNTPASSATAGKATASYITVWQSLALHRQPTIVGKVRTLWTGVGASLLKDVPFAALYWSLLEPVKGALSKSEVFDAAPATKVVMVNAASGATAGGLAAALTIPFDVIKTHTQTSHQHSPHTPQMNVMRAALDIAGQRGWMALFAGCMPRSIRTAVAYAILMASYEQCKKYCVQPPPLYPNMVNQ